MSRTGGGYGTKDAGEAGEGKTSPPTSPSSKENDDDNDHGGKTSENENEGKTSSSSSSAAGGGTGGTDDALPIVIEAGGRAKQGGPNLVQRFVDFVFRVIHTEMDEFFTRNADLFDQDWDDFNQQGETLEQYNVFKRYEELLDTHLSRFAEKESYDSAVECFQELERLVKEDAEEHKRRMEELQETIKKRQEEARRIKEGGAGGKEGEDPSQIPAAQPLMMFFQPISLEQLMQMVSFLSLYHLSGHTFCVCVCVCVCFYFLLESQQTHTKISLCSCSALSFFFLIFSVLHAGTKHGRVSYFLVYDENESAASQVNEGHP